MYGMLTTLIPDTWSRLMPYGPRQAKICLRACAKCTGSGSSHGCAKSDPGVCSPLIDSDLSLRCPLRRKDMF